MSKSRMDAFSDGVFAIAITLLVINLLPIRSDLVHHWPDYAAFAFSFIVIGVMWVNHHHLMDQLQRADRVLLFLNLLLAYGITGIYLSIFFNVLWHYGRTHVLRPDCDPKVVSGISRSYMPGILLYLTGTLIALGSPVGSAIFYAVIAVFYAVSNTFFGKEPIGT